MQYYFLKILSNMNLDVVSVADETVENLADEMVENHKNDRKELFSILLSMTVLMGFLCSCLIVLEKKGFVKCKKRRLYPHAVAHSLEGLGSGAWLYRGD